MDEQQIALEAAKVALSLKEMDLYSDFLKVGIPSFVAVVSAFVTWRVSINNTKASIENTKISKTYEEKIAILNHRHDYSKIVDDRTNKLLMELSELISRCCNSQNKYSNEVLTILHIIDIGDIVDDELFESASTLKSKAIEEWGESEDSIYSKANLIGDDNLVACIEKYEAKQRSFRLKYDPFCKKGFEEYNGALSEVEAVIRNMYKNLSLIMHGQPTIDFDEK